MEGIQLALIQGNLHSCVDNLNYSCQELAKNDGYDGIGLNIMI